MPSDCPDGNWGPPGPDKKLRGSAKDPLLSGTIRTGITAPQSEGEQPEQLTDEEKKQRKRSLIISIATLLLSIPALIGAWCWPALVIGLVSGTVTAGAREAGHLISFIITLLLMLFINGFMIYTLKNRYGPCCQKFGPLICTLIAAPLILADLVRHLLQDHGVWKECVRNNVKWDEDACRWASNQYHCDRTGPDHCTDHENIAHLSMIGWLFTIVFTYTGFIMLFIGVLWNANILQKCGEIKQQWKELRAEYRELNDDGSAANNVRPAPANREGEESPAPQRVDYDADKSVV